MTQMSAGEFAKRAAIVVMIAALPPLLWYLRDFLLVLVGAVLVAMLLQLVSEPFTRWLGLPHGLALTVSGLLILCITGGTVYLFGTQLVSEIQDVVNRAEAATSSIRESLEHSELGRLVLAHAGTGSISVTSLAGNLASQSMQVLEQIVFTVAAGVYLAVQPNLYRKGLAALFNPGSRRDAEETLDDIGRALRLWLLGQGIQMFLIGALSAGAVWLIGLPSPIALGAIAGVCEFVPYLGPLIASVPAILVAMNSGLYTAIWTIVAYLIIHQIEGNVIVPIIQRQLIFLPPAVLILSIVVVSMIFGDIGIIFAAPMTVIAFVVVKKLYLREVLGQPTSLPGEPAP
ncbi:AI-2E family transporter [Bradyrhizobium sp. CCBAU 53415]|uniref:AI-2E family transporter n=1 Tax=Bradyrhizobium sp. CCBAU 53415 TaxID=1325119 RepID=UPI002305A3A2|nr:AI-2E family transporter [Bradyrhizobium sp. CCBAU 53415]